MDHYYIGPRLISSTGWKQPSLRLSGIYNRWKSSNPKILDWFLNFLSQNKELDYESLSAGGKAIVKDFGFDVNVFQRKRNVKIGPPPYAQDILNYTGRVEIKKTDENDEVRRLREELRKCKEGEDDRPPPPLPPKEEEEEEKEKEVLTPPPPPPPSQSSKTANTTRPVNQMESQKAKLKKPTPVVIVKKEEPKDKLFEAVKKVPITEEQQKILDRRKGIEDDDSDYWNTESCIICSNLSFTQCECCSQVYCSKNCQNVHH